MSPVSIACLASCRVSYFVEKSLNTYFCLSFFAHRYTPFTFVFCFCIMSEKERELYHGSVLVVALLFGTWNTLFSLIFVSKMTLTIFLYTIYTKNTKKKRRKIRKKIKFWSFFAILTIWYAIAYYFCSDAKNGNIMHFSSFLLEFYIFFDVFLPSKN